MRPASAHGAAAASEFDVRPISQTACGSRCEAATSHFGCVEFGGITSGAGSATGPALCG